MCTEGMCNSEILCRLTAETAANGTVVSSNGICERPTFDQYTAISLVILLICIVYVRFVTHAMLYVIDVFLIRMRLATTSAPRSVLFIAGLTWSRSETSALGS